MIRPLVDGLARSLGHPLVSGLLASAALPVNLVAYESFPVAADVPLAGYVGYSKWTAHPANTTATSIVSFASEGLIGPTTGFEYYLSSFQPGSADYAVLASIVSIGSGGGAICARMDPATLTCYWGRYLSSSGGVFELWKTVGGVNTLLGSLPAAAPPSPYVLELRCIGSRISLRCGGYTVIAVTDASITAAGFAGVRLGASTVWVARDFWITDGTPGAVELTESFAPVADTPLAGYVGGLTWIGHPVNAVSNAIVSAANSGISTASSLQYYLVTAAPPSPNYSVIAHITAAAPGGGAICVRFDAVTLTGYFGRYLYSAGVYEIYKIVAGVAEPLRQVSAAAPVGTYALELSCDGDQITLLVNGVIVASATDSAITAAGFGGVRLTQGASFLMHDFSIRWEPDGTALPNVNVLDHGWDTTGGGIQTQNTGDEVRFNFTGPSLEALCVADPGVSGYLLGMISGNPLKRYQLKGGRCWMPLFSNPGSTGLKSMRLMLGGNSSIVDNWNGPTNRCRILAFRLAGGGALAAYTPRSKKGVVIGDSIPRGRGITDRFRLGDASRAWPTLLGDMIDTDFDFICFSGEGFTGMGAGNVPKVSAAIGYYSNGRVRQSDPTVQIVLVPLGTNDGAASEATLRADARAAWIAIRNLYTSAKIFGILPLGYSVNSANPSALAVRNIRNGWIASEWAAWGDGNCQLLDLTGGVYGGSMLGPLEGGSNAFAPDLIHPNDPTNVLMAADIRAQMILP